MLNSEYYNTQNSLDSRVSPKNKESNSKIKIIDNNNNSSENNNEEEKFFLKRQRS